MTPETQAALPHILSQSSAPNPAATPPPAGPRGFMPTMAPPQAPGQIQAPPPSPFMGSQGGGRPEPVEPANPKLDRGKFPIKIIASIQMIYAQEQAKQERLQGNIAAGMGLKPGWGGAD